MFCDMKNDLENPTVRKLVSASAYDQSIEATDKRIEEFRRREDLYLYGWLENDEILGICGIEVHSNNVVIRSITVEPDVRKRGIGKAMITAVQKNIKRPLQLDNTLK